MCFGSCAGERSIWFFISGPLYLMDSILSGMSLIFMSDTGDCTSLLHGLCLSSPPFFSPSLSLVGVLWVFMQLYVFKWISGFSIFLYGYSLLDPLLFICSSFFICFAYIFYRLLVCFYKVLTLCQAVEDTYCSMLCCMIFECVIVFKW